MTLLEKVCLINILKPQKMGTTIGVVLISYDVSRGHTEVKNAMKANRQIKQLQT